MLRYALRRVLLTIPTVFLVLTVVFVVVRVLPGDPAVAVLGDYASADAVRALRTKMGLDEPLFQQYLRFLGGLVQGDLGKSLVTGKPISQEVARVLPYSLQLAGFAVVVGTVLGVPTGAYTAIKRNALADHIGRLCSLVGLSLPAFCLAVLLMLIFSIKLNLLPATGGGDLDDWSSSFSHLVLPGSSLGLIMTASVTRLTRSAMLDVLGEDFIRTARSKGLKERIVVLRHAFRASMVPILALIGMWIIDVIGSSVTTEIVFVRPGLGKLLVGAVLSRDYVALQSLMAVFTVLVAAVNLCTDLAYGLADPRTRR